MTMRPLTQGELDDVDDETTNVIISRIRQKLNDGTLDDGDAVQEEVDASVLRNLGGYFGQYQSKEGVLKPFKLVWAGQKLCVYTRSIPVSAR